MGWIAKESSALLTRVLHTVAATAGCFLDRERNPPSTQAAQLLRRVTRTCCKLISVRSRPIKSRLQRSTLCARWWKSFCTCSSFAKDMPRRKVCDSPVAGGQLVPQSSVSTAKAGHYTNRFQPLRLVREPSNVASRCADEGNPRVRMASRNACNKNPSRFDYDWLPAAAKPKVDQLERFSNDSARQPQEGKTLDGDV
jgi:hypothetical protein